MTMKPIHVIYHANCMDGLAAAWIVWRRFKDTAQYTPAHYGDIPPDVTGQKVYILDFSYPREVVLKMAQVAEKVTLLDHHKTAMAEWTDLPASYYEASKNLEVKFLTGMSGAQLAMTELNPTRSNWIVDYIGDRDLWHWKKPASKEVNAYLGTLETFEELDYAHLHLNPGRAATYGEILIKAQRKSIERTKTRAVLQDFEGHEIYVVNVHENVSETLHELCSETHPFALGWFHNGEKYIYSLRSIGDFDVSVIAKRYGGGGHRNAAGFTSVTRA